MDTDISTEQVLKTIGKRSFCTLATTSPAQRPHVAAVVYVAIDETLYVTTGRNSRKGRNIAANPNVAVCVPVRRLPVGPPSVVQFQGIAELLDPDDPELASVLAAGRLKGITSHGEMDEPDSCFVRIKPNERLFTFGLGMPLRQLLRDPIHAGGAVTL